MNQNAQRIKQFCIEATRALGYKGDRPVEYWEGCILKYLQAHRPDNHHVRLNVPLTIFSEDFPELTEDLCRHMQEHGDAAFRYEAELVQ